MESNQYKAFGVKDYAFIERPQATGYIGKEKDSEMNLAEHGVRKYDSDLGRFLCPDALWEKYISFTPYQYSLNNPISNIDWDGKVVVAMDEYTRSEIINSVESKYRNNIGFMSNGTVYLKNKTGVGNLENDLSNFTNYGALKALINTENETFYLKEGNSISISDNENNQIFDLNLDDKNIKSSGAFSPRYSSKDANTSTLDQNEVIINKTIYQTHLTNNKTKNTPGRTIAHELYGHALLWYWEKYKGWGYGKSHDGKSGEIIIKAEENVDK